jgi:alkanesulfonate monooxygenase SsuD/methylene tetrahydromethanopterin reductase-like flavin-dependent oxidoreductase (luciferase family)
MAVWVLPFHHPLRLAEETATLDILSKGRLVVGLGRGNRPQEFLGHGVPQEESRSRMQEGLEVLRRAWTQERVSFEGRHWQFDEIPVYPKPLTKPHPPLVFAVTSPESLQWAGINGLAIMSSGLTTPTEALIRQRETYLAALTSAGHSDLTISELLGRWIVSKHVYVAPTDAEARADAEGPERWYLDSFARSIRPDGLRGISEAVRQQATASADRVSSLRWEELIEDRLLIGSPETVRRRVEALKEIGVGQLICWMSFGGLPPKKVRRSMELFAREVIGKV